MKYKSTEFGMLEEHTSLTRAYQGITNYKNHEIKENL
jgi:hypothetical protein